MNKEQAEQLREKVTDLVDKGPGEFHGLEVRGDMITYDIGNVTYTVTGLYVNPPLTSEHGHHFALRSEGDLRTLLGAGCVHKFSIGLYGNGILIHCDICHKGWALEHDSVIKLV